jgi:ATP-dependent Clp protease ATP-binding subunit ClpA
MTDRNRFDRFTERARKVLSLAQEESQRFQHNYIGTEHLLLGLVREGEGAGARVLKEMGVELNRVRSAVEQIIGRGDRIVLGEIGLTPRAKKVIELAVDEAHRLDHHYIGTEHIFLGLIREGSGIAAGVLESMGVNLESARTATLRILGQPAPFIGTGATDESAAATPAQAGATSPSWSAAEDTPESEPGVAKPFLLGGHTSFSRYPLNERGKLVILLAQEEARRLQHGYIGTEHLLLGLASENKGIAAWALKIHGGSLAKIRSAVEFIIGQGDRTVLGEVGLTPRAHQVVKYAVEEAHSLKQDAAASEHILLGLLREGQGIAVGVLESLGIDMERLRTEILQAIQQVEEDKANDNKDGNRAGDGDAQDGTGDEKTGDQ